MTQAIINKIKQKPFQLFVVKLLVFISLVYLLDFTVGKLLKYFYFKQQSGLQYRTTYSMEQTRADILAFGASRANHHYHARVFESDIPNYTFYNAGRDGNSIFYHYAVLKSILRRYSPKIVILDFEIGSLAKNSESYDRLSSLLPYYNDHPEIRSIVNLKSAYEKFKLYSHIYPFNSALFTIAIGNVEMNKSRANDINGYVPLHGIWEEPIGYDTNTVSKNILDSNKISCYENFIKDCTTRGIKVCIFVSPYFIKYKNADYSVLKGQEIAKKYHADFYDHTTDTTFTSNRLLFADLVHLNDNGAKLYSKMVVQSILQHRSPAIH